MDTYKEAKEVLNYTWELSRKTKTRKSIIYYTLSLLIIAIDILVETCKENGENL